MKTTALTLLLLPLAFNTFSQHTIVLKDGKKYKGVVLEIYNDTLLYATAQKSSKIHMQRVSSIFFDEFVPYDGRLVDSDPEKSIRSGDYLIKYKLKDRDMVAVPVISNGTQEKGLVVVEISVNRNGNVMNAKPGATGSTTSSEYLYTKAKFAAQGARFNVSKTGPVETNGTISIQY